jgi:hypothetical protein
VPDNVTFATKSAIALAQVKAALNAGVTPGVVLADPAYGDSAAFRDQLTEWGLIYAVGIRSTTRIWPPGMTPLPPIPTVGRGRPSKNLRRAPGHPPVSVKELAMSLPESAYQTIRWREGTNDTLTSRFAAVRIRTANKDYSRSTLRPEEWLLIEWPEGDTKPLKYFLGEGGWIFYPYAKAQLQPSIQVRVLPAWSRSPVGHPPRVGQVYAGQAGGETYALDPDNKYASQGAINCCLIYYLKKSL